MPFDNASSPSVFPVNQMSTDSLHADFGSKPLDDVFGDFVATSGPPIDMPIVGMTSDLNSVDPLPFDASSWFFDPDNSAIIPPLDQTGSSSAGSSPAAPEALTPPFEYGGVPTWDMESIIGLETLIGVGSLMVPSPPTPQFTSNDLIHTPEKATSVKTRGDCNRIQDRNGHVIPDSVAKPKKTTARNSGAPLGVQSRSRAPLPPIIISDINNTRDVKRARNTLAARRSRANKEAQTALLTERNQALEHENGELKQENGDLKQKNAYLSKRQANLEAQVAQLKAELLRGNSF